ncbi:MAG: hypothetical protein WC175_04125 [Candidatus Dojkabacteria bacterium]
MSDVYTYHIVRCILEDGTDTYVFTFDDSDNFLKSLKIYNEMHVVTQEYIKCRKVIEWYLELSRSITHIQNAENTNETSMRTYTKTLKYDGNI